MKQFAKSVVALALGVGLYASAGAAVIIEGPFNGTNVGNLDIFVEATETLEPVGSGCNVNGNGSSPAAEECWVNFVLSSDLEFEVRTETLPIYSTDVSNAFAFELSGQPDYFLVKNATFWALFENVEDLDWGVINASLLPAGMNINDGTTTISHVSEFNGGDVGGPDLPLPGSLLLLGAGFLGAALISRKRAT